MGAVVKRLNGPRCTAKNRRGEPCQALAGTDGLCTAHRDPERMRELGRKGGKAGGEIKPERVPEGLRAYLQREVPPSRIWQALETAMNGQSEAARVSAARVLLDALSDPSGEEDWREQMAGRFAGAKQQLLARLDARADSLRRRPLVAEEVREWLDAVLDPLVRGVDPSVLRQAQPMDFSNAENQRALDELLGRRVEAEVQRRVAALREEFGIPTP
jgi:Stress-induced bacterial acidophilic repeat motif